MFDQLWEESPTIQKMRAEYLEKGIEKEHQAALQRELQGLRHLLVSVIQPKYPEFVELAQRQGNHCDDPEALRLLIQQVATALNADTVREYLEQKTV